MSHIHFVRLDTAGFTDCLGNIQSLLASAVPARVVADEDYTFFCISCMLRVEGRLAPAA